MGLGGDPKSKGYGSKLNTGDATSFFYMNDRLATETHEAELKKGDPSAPPSAPDLTDKLLGDSRKSQMLRTLSGRGRKSTFLTGPMGDTTIKPVRKTLLGGY